MSTSIYAEHVCNLCKFPATHYSGRNKYWCSKNPSSCAGVKEIKKQKALEKYGVDNVSKSKLVKNSISIANLALANDAKMARKETVRIRYGVDTVMEVKEFRDNVSKAHLLRSKDDITSSAISRRATCLEKYGKEFVGQVKSIRDSIESTNIEKYGCIAPMMNLSIKEKSVSTCLEKYGVENPSQDPTIIAKIRKNQFKTKSFIFPSGKEVLVQGYESRAITELLKIYHEEEIIVETELIPRIEYTGLDGKQHYYFPDIYILKDNLIIEVKSRYTFNKEKETVLLKEKATISDGFNYRFIIYK